MATQIVAPGGNLAPGYYIQFGFENETKKAAGPFDVKVSAGASTYVIVCAP